MASGRVEAQTVYLHPNNNLSYKSLISQSLGWDLSPPLTPPQALGRSAVGKLEALADLPNPQFLVVFSFWSLQASQDITT